MRILIIGGFHLGSLCESYARAFERLGHEVFRFDSDRAYFQASRLAVNPVIRRLFRPLLWSRVNLSTIEVVRCVRPKLVLSVKGAYLHPETVRHIRVKEGISIINYYADNPYCGVPLNPRKTSAQRCDLIQVLRQYSRVYVWGEHLVKRLEADGVSASYLPFGVDSEQYRPFPWDVCEECGKPHAVVFVGQCGEKRRKHLEEVRRHQVGLWGPGWERVAKRFGRHRIHAFQAFGSVSAALYSRAEVSLNIVDDLNMPGHNMRTFEIPASGGVMLSTYTAEQAELFPEGEAAWYYRAPSEIDDILEEILGDKEAQGRIRGNARKIAQDHDYIKRAEGLLKEIIGKTS